MKIDKIVKTNDFNSVKYLIRIWIIIAFMIGILIICGIKIYIHEKMQNDIIREQNDLIQVQQEVVNDLQAKYSELEDRIIVLNADEEMFSNNCTEEGMDLLFIGNSITIHPVCDYWWGEYGMAASEEKYDYVHQVIVKLESYFHKDINYTAFNYTDFELQYYDRAETYSKIEPLLNDKIDYIVLQLGENVLDNNTWETDFLQLCRYIMRKSCNAKILVISNIIVIHNLEKSEEIDSNKKKIANSNGYIWIDLYSMHEDSSYMAGLGSEVSGIDGEKRIIEHNGVAMHPGDKGMAYIAQKIANVIVNDVEN